jgi:hypothetical protein
MSSSSNLLLCRLCKRPIKFSDKYVSHRTGRKIPLDVDTEQPHDCPVWKGTQQYQPQPSQSEQSQQSQQQPSEWQPSQQQLQEQLQEQEKEEKQLELWPEIRHDHEQQQPQQQQKLRLQWEREGQGQGQRERQRERRYQQCRRGHGQLIYFDANHKSLSGKWIPVDRKTELPHQCQQ